MAARAFCVMIFMLVVTGLSACGKTGPLYLPDETAESTTQRPVSG